MPEPPSLKRKLRTNSVISRKRPASVKKVIENDIETPMMSDSTKGEGSECFEAAREKTLKVLSELVSHWRICESSGVAAIVEAVESVINDPDELSAEGHAWSRQVQLGYVLPRGACRCRPLHESIGRDGLQVSKSGGPVVPVHPALIVAPAPPCGYGVYATQTIPAGTELGEYLGEARAYDVWCYEIKRTKVDRRGSDASSPFIPEELYAAWTGSGPKGAGVVVDAFGAGNTMRFVNCSCFPNANFKDFGRGIHGHSRVKVQAARDIHAWEQISLNYGWFYDDATLQDVRNESVQAFNRDVPAILRISSILNDANKCSAANDTRDAKIVVLRNQGNLSEAMVVISETAARALATPDEKEIIGAKFLSRFVDPTVALKFLETEGASVKCVQNFREIPEAVWPLYEVVGGDIVGIPCRCGLDPSLNSTGKCSGIIGRPLQAKCDGREEDLAVKSEWLA